MARRYSSSFSRLVSNVLVFMAVFAVVGYFFLNSGIQEKLVPLTVTIENKEIKKDSSLTLIWGHEYSIDVSKKGYSVQVLVNEANDFDFVLNDGYERFSKEKDYTEFFNITKQRTYFTFQIEKNMTLESVLKAKYTGQAVSVETSEDIFEKAYFYILIKADEKSIKLDFKKHYTIILDKDGIIF